MKKNILLLCLQIVFCLSIKAQFTDDFSDGDWSKNPTWVWQPDSFIVNAKKELQLNAKIGGVSKIAVDYNIEKAMVWEFLVKMDFAPSNTNRVLVSLTRNSTTQPTVSGYILYMGEDGTDDKIKLYQASTNTLVATCKNTFVVNNLVNTRLRIKRDANNLWTIEADYSGGFAFKPEASFQETTNFQAVGQDNYFAFWCEYTASRADKFFFDDINVYSNQPDITPPTVTSALLDSKIPNRVNVQFSEVVDSISAKTLLAYQLDNGIGNPLKVTYNFNKVSLDFQNLQNATTYNLLVNTVADLSKNVMKPQTISFTTASIPNATQSYDVIINEILADPLPQVGLPKAEFLELYNRTSKPIDLQGFSIKDKGATLYKLPKFILQPDKYVIVYKRDKNINFGKYGDTLALGSLFTLDSDNEEISLFNDKNELMDKVNYGLATYQDEKKANGGWSLERINPNTPCLGAANFKASVSNDGGTPGKVNSIFSKNIDKTPLQEIYTFPTNNQEIFIRFNKNLDFSTLQNTVFEIETGIANIDKTLNNNELKIILSAPMQKGKIYNLKLKNTLKDCVGNVLEEKIIQLGVAEEVQKNDVIVNEILFNPSTGGVDFVEIYNRSKKIININDLSIDNRKKLDQQEIDINYLLLPNEYVVITSSKVTLLAQKYYIKNKNAVIESSLPSFDDDEGNVILIKADAPGKQIIDEMDYEKTYHYPLLKDQSGVSLERINFDAASNDKNNWYSASSTVGFATPTYQNSQFLLVNTTHNEAFALEKSRISPDNDGFEDFLLINYKNDQVGTTANIDLFDTDGRFVKNLVNNELLSTEGNIRWDGDVENGGKAPIGIYVLLINYFTPDGKTNQEKKLVTVVGRL